MFENTKAYSGFAVRDLGEARTFYGETLGLPTSEEHGLMWLHLAGGRDTLGVSAAGREPGELHDPELRGGRRRGDCRTRSAARGVRFERYEGIAQDEKECRASWVRPSPGSRIRPETCCP